MQCTYTKHTHTLINRYLKAHFTVCGEVFQSNLIVLLYFTGKSEQNHACSSSSCVDCPPSISPHNERRPDRFGSAEVFVNTSRSPKSPRHTADPPLSLPQSDCVLRERGAEAPTLAHLSRRHYGDKGHATEMTVRRVVCLAAVRAF